jgi:hypothetical protein
MTENVIAAAIRAIDKRRGVPNADVIERLVIVAKSDLPMEARRRLVAELGLN